MIGVKVYEEVQKLFCLDRVMSNAIKGKKVMIITANDVIFEIIKRIILPSFFFFFLISVQNSPLFEIEGSINSKSPTSRKNRYNACRIDISLHPLKTLIKSSKLMCIPF